MQKARLEIDGPATMRIEHVIRRIPAITQSFTLKDDRVSQTFEGGPFAPLPEEVPGQPAETTLPGYVAYTTGASWAAVAAAYADIVDRQIGKPDLTAFVRDAKNGLDGKRDRDAIVGRLVARLGADVKYTGIEFGEASIIPRTPAEVFERRYGDCKDKALLLTALLRAAGIPAEVALLDSGFGPDVDPDVPGFGGFDHAIVYVPGGKPLWIDATDQFSAVGELPLGDQGRLALVATRKTTALVRTPETPSSANLTRETRAIKVAEDGKVRVVEDLGHDRVGRSRPPLRLRPRRAKADRGAARWLRARDLPGQDAGALADLRLLRRRAARCASSSRPRTPASARSPTRTSRCSCRWRSCSSGCRSSCAAPTAPNTSAPPRRRRARSTTSTRTRTRTSSPIRSPAPHGFLPDALPPSETITLGPARYTTGYRVEPDGTVRATFRFDSGKARFSPPS